MEDRRPPNEIAPYLLAEVIEHGDENGALANATADDLRDALMLAANKIRRLRSMATSGQRPRTADVPIGPVDV